MSEPAAKIAVALIGAMATAPNESRASLDALLTPPSALVKMSVVKPSETYSRPLATLTAIEPGSEVIVPMPFGIDGTLMLNASTDVSPSAAKSVDPLIASERTFGLLVVKMAGVFDGVVGSRRSHCESPVAM